MKKILASLLVLALCAPAMAATITLADVGGGQATITVATEAGEANIVGLGLDVDVTGGTVTAVSVDTADFNIFPDAAYTQELGAGYAYGTGTPVADKTAPGEVALPQSSFALSLGMLNGEAVAGADGAASVVITVTWSGDQLDVCENATRGGIVAVDGAALDADCAMLAGDGDCYTGPQFAQWVAVGKPDGWCASVNPRQCLGDTDGLPSGKNNWWVSTPDLNVLVAAWNKPFSEIDGQTFNGVPLINADFDHLPSGKSVWRVSTPDLNILVANWNQNNAPAPTCP
jgi:hypothetical protein